MTDWNILYEEWRLKVLADEYRWDLIASKLLDVVSE